MHRAPRLMLIAGAILLSAWCLAASGQAAEGEKAIDIGDRKQLLIDNLFFEKAEGIALHVNPPAKTGERSLVSDRPWENATLNWFTFLQDPGGQAAPYRMWYECYDVEGWPTADDTSFCHAESTDGIHWAKPSLNLFAYHGSTDNNILFRQIGPEGARSRVHGTCVFIDPTAPPEARYKAVSQGIFDGATPPHRIAGMSSADGLHWNRLARPICDIFADSQYTGFYDDAISQYVLYGRAFGRGRAIGRSSSVTFDRFDPLTLVFENDAQDPGDNDLYNPAVIKYAYADRAYFMFTSLYRHAEDTLDIQLATSRDGVHWTWPERGKAFIALGEAGAFDGGSLYLGQGVIRQGDELWQYYSGSPLRHNACELDALAKPENKRVISRVISRLDGFVSADAGEQGGSFVTPPVRFRGAALHLNARCGQGGEIRVGLLDGAGNPIADRAAEDCLAITGDSTDAIVAWKTGSDVSVLQDKPVKLAFQMKNASLCAFQFSAPAAQEEGSKLAFRVHRVGTYRGEACGVGDFNNDGRLDIVALPYLYLAPEFAALKICDVEGEVDDQGKGYRNDFMNAPLDIDGDGWLDVATCSWFGKKAEWLKNPGAAGGLWPRTLIEENGNYECGELWDIDGDGKPLEILPAVVGTIWYEAGVVDGQRTVLKHVISDKPMEWGDGCGDVNGDGRPDVLRPNAWFEAPADPRTGAWVEHPLAIGNIDPGKPGHTPQILVYDVDANGLADIVTSSAHEYGIFWYRQMRQGADVTWQQHLIDKSWSQAHSLALADLDGDGDLDLVTGKRFMAHNGGDPGEMDPPGVYWYELVRQAGQEPRWLKHVLSFGENIGSGLNLVVADLDGDGDLDIVVTSKCGGPTWFENTLK